MPIRKRRAWWKTSLLWSVGLVLAAVALAVAAESHWEMPLWGYIVIAGYIFNYAFSTIIERLDLIQSQLDEIVSRFSDSHEPDLL